MSVYIYMRPEKRVCIYIYTHTYMYMYMCMSVMPLDVLGCTRATLMSLQSRLKWPGNLFQKAYVTHTHMQSLEQQKFGSTSHGPYTSVGSRGLGLTI